MNKFRTEDIINNEIRIEVITTREIRIEDITDDMLRDLWLSEQLPYSRYVGECERRGIQP